MSYRSQLVCNSLVIFSIFSLIAIPSLYIEDYNEDGHNSCECFSMYDIKRVADKIHRCTRFPYINKTFVSVHEYAKSCSERTSGIPKQSCPPVECIKNTSITLNDNIHIHFSECFLLPNYDDFRYYLYGLTCRTPSWFILACISITCGVLLFASVMTYLLVAILVNR